MKLVTEKKFGSYLFEFKLPTEFVSDVKWIMNWPLLFTSACIEGG